jgi:hypothetical protein
LTFTNFFKWLYISLETFKRKNGEFNVLKKYNFPSFCGTHILRVTRAEIWRLFGICADRVSFSKLQTWSLTTGIEPNNIFKIQNYVTSCKVGPYFLYNFIKHFLLRNPELTHRIARPEMENSQILSVPEFIPMLQSKSSEIEYRNPRVTNSFPLFLRTRKVEQPIIVERQICIEMQRGNNRKKYELA